MNALETYIDQQDEDPTAIMNRLQGFGIVSDLCVMPADVDATDAKAAVEWMQANPD